MTREMLLTKLENCPKQLAYIEERLLESEDALADAEWAHAKAEDKALLCGAIDGKNEAIRAAQLREQTAETRAKVVKREREVATWRRELRIAQAEFSATRAMARLVATDEVERKAALCAIADEVAP